MRTYLIMAIRNLRRHKKRSMMTGIMIGVAALTMLLTLAFSQSIAAKMTDSIVRNYTGNIQIHAPVRGEIQVFMAAADDTPFLKDSRRILQIARRERDVYEASPRLRLQGLLSNGEDAMGITAIGIDSKRERKVSPKIKVVKGSYLTHGKGILLAKKVAQYFDARIGQEFVIVTTTPDGYTNGISLQLAGIVSAEGMEAFFDDTLVYMDIHAARRLLYLNRQEVSEVVLALKEGAAEERVIPALEKAYRAGGLRVRLDRWQDVAGMLSGILMAGVMLPQMALVILLIVVAFGISNTILMAVLERTPEIGTMMALGAKRREIITLFMVETATLGAIAAGIGCLIGAGIIYYLSRVGIPATVEALEFIFGGKRFYFIFSWTGIAVSFGGIVFFSALVTALPARLATRFNPVEALRQV